MIQNQEQNRSASQGDSFGLQKFVLAILIFLAYLIFIVYMLYESKTTDLAWTRMLYLFSGLEAIVFAALGYVFGKDVHRIRAEKAEERAEDAKKSEKDAKKEAEKANEKARIEKEKGIQLSTAVVARNMVSEKASSSNFEFIKSTAKQSNHSSSDFFLVDLVNKLYPDKGVATLSFEYEISPPEKIISISINNKRKTSKKGSYSGIYFIDNSFEVDVELENDLDDWTLKITRIWDTDGNEKKQIGGKLEGSGQRGIVKLEDVQS